MLNHLKLEKNNNNNKKTLTLNHTQTLRPLVKNFRIFQGYINIIKVFHRCLAAVTCLHIPMLESRFFERTNLEYLHILERGKNKAQCLDSAKDDCHTNIRLFYFGGPKTLCVG